MIGTDKLTKTKEPPVQELESLIGCYRNEYNSYRKANGGPVRQFKLFKKNGEDKGKFYNHFVTLHKVLQNFKQINPLTFIRAQFFYQGLILPHELFINNAVSYYNNYSAKLEEKDAGIEELKEVLKSAKIFMDGKCREWGIESSVEEFFTYKKDDECTYKSIVLLMTLQMPGELFLCNSETYRSLLFSLPADIRQDIPLLNSAPMKTNRQYYLKDRELIEFYQETFGEEESIL